MSGPVRRQTSSAWVARGSLAMAVLAAIALGATVYVAHRALATASDVVIRGEGDVLVAAIMADLADGADETDGPPTDDELARELEKTRASGTRYLALVGRDSSTPFAHAGNAKIDAPLDRPGAPVVVGARARVVAMVFPRHMARPPGPRPEHAAGPPLLVVEFEPPIMSTLRGDLHRISLVAAAAAAVILALALAWSRSATRLAKVEQQATREQRLVALGSMSSVMAHELRNPLASLKGHAQLLLEDLADEKQKTKATRVIAEAERLEVLTTSLLDFVRDGPIDLDTTTPSALVDRALEHVPRARVAVDTAKAPPKLFIDAGRAARAIHNLVQNALQATSGDEEVSLVVTKISRDVVVEVRDHGPGLPPGSEAQIFEPFITTRVKGTGLGLPVARRIAEQHGGTLTGETHPDGGAVFRLRLADAARDA